MEHSLFQVELIPFLYPLEGAQGKGRTTQKETKHFHLSELRFKTFFDTQTIEN